MKPTVLLFGAIGPYPKALSRALAPHAELLACIVPRPVSGGFEWLFRHRLLPVDATGFACRVLSIGAYRERKVYTRLPAADLVVVAGFPRKLPAAWVNALGRYGAVNVHPSLLPRDRGPAPAFWALKRGDSKIGVSVHALTDVVDGGDILFQAAIEAPFALDGVRLLERFGTLGGELLAEKLGALAGPWHLTPQGDDVGPWARPPKHADFEIIPADWTCRRLFHFVRGARAFGSPWAKLADEVHYFAEALDYSEGRQMPGEFMLIGPNMMLRVADGTVSLRLL